MIDLATGNYTAEAVQRALHAALGSRRVWYRYERLNQYKLPIAPSSSQMTAPSTGRASCCARGSASPCRTAG